MDKTQAAELVAWITNGLGQKRANKYPGINSYAAKEVGIELAKTLVIRGAARVIVIGSKSPRCVIACEKPDDFEQIQLTQTGSQILIHAGCAVQGGKNAHGAVQIISGHTRIVAGRDLIIGNNVIINGQKITSAATCMAIPIICIALPEVPNIALEGSSDVLLLDINQERIEFTLSGSGDIKAEGKVSAMSAMIQGSGDVCANKLKAQSAHLFIMGSGNISAHAQSGVLAKIMGSGDINIHGRPESVEQTVLGSGRIKIHK